MAINRYPVGSLVNVAVTFRDSAGTPTDPSTVTLQFQDPAGTVTTWLYGTDAQPIRSSAGVFAANLNAASEGIWRYRWVGTGACQAAIDGEFLVGDSGFV